MVDKIALAIALFRLASQVWDWLNRQSIMRLGAQEWAKRQREIEDARVGRANAAGRDDSDDANAAILRKYERAED